MEYDGPERRRTPIRFSWRFTFGNMVSIAATLVAASGIIWAAGNEWQSTKDEARLNAMAILDLKDRMSDGFGRIRAEIDVARARRDADMQDLRMQMRDVRVRLDQIAPGRRGDFPLGGAMKMGMTDLPPGLPAGASRIAEE